MRYDYSSIGFYTFDCLGWPFTTVPEGGGTHFIDELTLAGLTPAASQAVRPPRIAESPVSFECRVLTSLVTGPRQTAVIGRIVRAHVDDAVILDKERCHIDTQALRLIARMHGSGWYARSTDLFQIDRPSWTAWQENNGKAKPA